MRIRDSRSVLLAVLGTVCVFIGVPTLILDLVIATRCMSSGPCPGDLPLSHLIPIATVVAFPVYYVWYRKRNNRNGA